MIRSRRSRFRRCLQLEFLETRELLAADFRSIDGTGNNQNPGRNDWGAADTNLIRFGYPGDYPDGFGDQIVTQPNPRTVSNLVSTQTEPVFDDRNLSDWHVQWGQFLTHDLDLTGTAAANNTLSTGQVGDFRIPVDANDILGPNPIPFNRSNFDPTTGTNTRTGQPPRPNWREQVNEITSYIDASNVYGSDAARAAALRTFVDGKLETSSNGLLPGLNDAGEENDDPFRRNPSDLFLAGDVRANEQIGLSATHALFVREHNRLADLIKQNNPAFTDEEIYQWARKIVGAEMQIITYEEYLPAMMGTSAPNPNAYQYSTNVNASITNSFAASFFRFGHSQQSSTIQLTNNDGSSAGEFSLASVFFNPDLLKNDPTLVEKVLKGLASQVAQEVDTLLVDEIRNFLFGPPGAGGMDLAALDIQRGRDHGLPDYNQARRSYNLFPFNNFNQITSDVQLRNNLQSLYGNINNVDSWIGALAEDHLPGKSIGPMLNASFIDQFSRLRDGDRYFYTGDVDLQDPVVTQVIDLNNLTLAEVIRKNTAITNIQDNVFIAAAGFRVLADNDLQVNESGSESAQFEVVLTKQPTSSVVLQLSSSDTGEATTNVSSLIFTPSNWSTPQVVTILGVDDSLTDGTQESSINIAINASQSDNEFDGLSAQSVNVATLDNDVPSLAVFETGGSTIVMENGAADTFSVQLMTQPTSDVVLGLSMANQQVSLGSSELIFDAANWNVPQSVSIHAVDNHRIDGARTSQVTVAVLQDQSAEEYRSVGSVSVSVDVLDDDLPGITVTETGDGTAVSEDGDTDQFSVALTAEPASNVTLIVFSDNDSEISLGRSSVEFTPANWNTPQPVTVAAIDDERLDGDTSTIVRVAVDPTQSDAAFAEAQGQSLSVTALDNDAAGFLLLHTDDETLLSEDGLSDSVTLQLTTQPSSDVVIALALSDASEATLDLTEFTFSSSNWNVPQTANLTPIDDVTVDGTQAFQVVASIVPERSNDTFDTLPNQSLEASVLDNDVAGFSVVQTDGTTEVTEGGAADTFSVRLDRRPQSDVVIDLESSNTSEASLSQNSLLFTSENWDVYQSVNVLPLDDAIVDGTEEFQIVAAVTADSDAAFTSLSAQLSATTLDNDLAGLVVVATDEANVTSEDGGTDSFQVTLSAEPLDDVAFSVASSDTSEVTVSIPSLLFTPENWDQPQTVTLQGENDDLLDGDQISQVQIAVIPEASQDLWDSISASVSVTNLDNEVARIMVAETDGDTQVSERRTVDSFNVTLNLAPTSNVVVQLNAADSTEFEYSPEVLTFTPGNWDQPQQVTVTGVDDQLADGDQLVGLELAVAPELSDDTFDAASAVSVAVLNNDDPFEISIENGPMEVHERIGGVSLGAVTVISAGSSPAVIAVHDPRFAIENGHLRMEPDQYLLYSDSVDLELTIQATDQNDSTRSHSEIFSFAVLENEAPGKNRDPFDVNDDSFVTPIDAFFGINLLNQREGLDQSVNYVREDGSLIYPDSNGDKALSPLDALLVINYLNEQSQPGGEGESSIDAPPASLAAFQLAEISIASFDEDEENLLELLAENRS